MNSNKTPSIPQYPTQFENTPGHIIIGSLCLIALIVTSLLWPALATGHSLLEILSR